MQIWRSITTASLLLACVVVSDASSFDRHNWFGGSIERLQNSIGLMIANPNGAFIQLTSESIEEPAPGKLVQEPSERTSFRFDYSSPSQSPNQRMHLTVLRTFEKVVGDAWKSTVQILHDQRQVALGIIVDADGWIVTKASEVQEYNDLQCRLGDGTRVNATYEYQNRELDLALLHVKYPHLPSVSWHEENRAKVGGWLATMGANKTPVAIGVVSVGPRLIRSERAVLGVGLGPAKNGALVTMVLPGGGAARAGIEEGDVINSIDDESLQSQDAVLKKIAVLHAGKKVTIGVVRDAKPLTLKAILMDLNPALLDATEMEVNGTVSARATGFSRVFQHDTVIAPHQCGGPLIDSHGNVVGINIARAGRVNSYALPMDIVVPAVREMLATVKTVPIADKISNVSAPAVLP